MKTCAFGEPKQIILHLWDESPRFQKFVLPDDMLECIEVWVHEFTEYAIWYALNRFGFHKDVLNKTGFTIILSDGETQIHKPAHVLTALHTMSTIQSEKRNLTFICLPSKYSTLFHLIKKKNS